METGGPVRDLSKEDRSDLKARLIGGPKDKGALAFETKAVRVFGPAAGIMARQLLFWDTKGHDEDGWVYKSRREMESETGLTRRNQEKARRVLVGRGVLEEEKRPVGHMRRQTLHYRLDLLRLIDLIPGAQDTDGYYIPTDDPDELDEFDEPF